MQLSKAEALAASDTSATSAKAEEKPRIKQEKPRIKANEETCFKAKQEPHIKTEKKPYIKEEPIFKYKYLFQRLFSGL